MNWLIFLLRLASLFSCFCSADHNDDLPVQEFQRYDGWYNNWQHNYGVVGSSLIFGAPPAYADGVYKAAGEGRPPAGVVSSKLLAGADALPLRRNLTALFAFFGQAVSGEMLSTVSSGAIACPPEPLPQRIGEFGECNRSADDGLLRCADEHTRIMPFFRVPFDPDTGWHPNNPRRPVNHVTSWIDASFVYGTSTPWVDGLRSFVGGRLLEREDYPTMNIDHLPLLHPPPPHMHPHLMHLEDVYLVGSFKSNQSPPLLAISVLLHRYHNVLADRLRALNPRSSDEDIFQSVRRQLIAVWQSIIINEFVPLFVGRPLAPYTGYRANVDPALSVEFAAAAFRFGHSLIPSGFYVRNATCQSGQAVKALALCSHWWHAAPVMTEYGLEAILRGLVSQQMERGDHVFASGLREHLFGPMRMTHRDLPALNVARGREMGLADFNTVRQAYGLPKVSNWLELNPQLFAQQPELLRTAALLYNYSMSDVDLFVGGMLESDGDLPGPTFRAIIEDQFLRIRDADRFWFENNASGLFTPVEVEALRRTRLSDVIAAVLEPMLEPGDPLLRREAFVHNAEALCPGQAPQVSAETLPPCGEMNQYDFFTGSEISFLVSFSALAAVPVVCLLVACGIARHRAASEARGVGGSRSRSRRRSTRRVLNAFVAFEHDAPSSSKKVQVALGPNAQIRVLNRQGVCARTIDLARLPKVTVRCSYGSERDFYLLVRVPKEFDLILSFDELIEREEFELALRQLLIELQKPVEEECVTVAHLFAGAVTESQRKLVLKNFFHTAFDQVFHAKCKEKLRQLRSHSVESTATACTTTAAGGASPRAGAAATSALKRQGLLGVELTKAEFAQALQLKDDSVFVEQMFVLADKDHNGYLSYAEFIDVLVLMSKGTLESKMRLLFDMYDMDNSNELNNEEFTTMIRSLLELANRDFTEQQLEDVVEGMLREGGLEQRTSLTFADFYTLIERHRSLIWDDDAIQKSLGEPAEATKRKPRPRGASLERPLSSVEVGGRRDSRSSMTAGLTEARVSRSWAQQRTATLLYYLENNWNQVVIVTAFLLITAALFVQTFVEYWLYKEHLGYRHVVGLGAATSRGAAKALAFTFSVLLLCVCRNVLTALRDTPVGYYLPGDSAINFHRLVAMVSLPLMVVHIIGHAINFYQIGTQPPSVLRCIMPEFVFDSDEMPKFHFWLFQTVPGVTGVLLVLLLSVMYVFSTAWARQHIYQAFWSVHRLFPVVFALMLLHGSYRLLQPPFFQYFFVFPASLYVCDWIISLRRQSVQLRLENFEVLPSGVLHLSFRIPRDVRLHSGQWARLACSAISDREYHPFTVTSAPHERRLAFYIRALGPWTRRLNALFSRALAADVPPPKMLLDGPYGSRHQDWFRFETVVLVGAGIGVTPFASVLKDLVQKVYQQRSDIACRSVYFVWLSRTHQQFEWFIDLLREIETRDEQGLIRTDIFVTQLLKDFDIRTMMLYVCEHQFQRLSQRSFFTGLRAKTHFGRPDFYTYLHNVQRRNSHVSKIGVFSSGPKSVIRTVDAACGRINRSSVAPLLIAHHEIF